MKEGGTGLHKTIREINLVYKGLKVRVAFSKPAHAARVRTSPPGANHSPFTAKPSSCHAHSTLRVYPIHLLRCSVMGFKVEY